MASAWATAFYHSRAWKACRRAFLVSKHWLCERCHRPAKIAHHKTYLTLHNINDPEVTLNWKNLEALCEDCHNKEHFEKWQPTRPSFAFDVEGNLVEGCK